MFEPYALIATQPVAALSAISSHRKKSPPDSDIETENRVGTNFRALRMVLAGLNCCSPSIFSSRFQTGAKIVPFVVHRRTMPLEEAVAIMLPLGEKTASKHSESDSRLSRIQ